MKSFITSGQNKKFFKFELPEKFEAEIKKLKTVLGHVGLYVGLIAYTALGALVIHQRSSLAYFGHSKTLSDGLVSIK